MYGHNAWAGNSRYEIGIDKRQLSLFRLDQSKIVARNDNNERYWYWLRDICSTSTFVNVNYTGAASNGDPSFANGVRPAFLIY